MPRQNFSRSILPSIACMLLLSIAIPTASYGKDHHRVEECNARTARSMSIAEASRSRRMLEQACVKLIGIIDGSTLYQDVDDIYRDTRVWRDHDPKLRMVARIGLRSFPENVEFPSGSTGLLRAVLIGRLHDCARDWWTGKDENGDIVLSMGSGWCHYNKGAVLTPIALVAPETVNVTRKTGRKEWRKFGDIAPSDNRSALAAEAAVFLDHLLDAARRLDKRRVLDLHDYSQIELTADGSKVAADELESVVGSDAQSVLDLWFGNSGAILSHAYLSAERPHVRFFEPRWKTDGWPEIWACWGTGSLAEDGWPISSLDATNVAGRPYACIKLVKEGHSSGSFDAVKEVWVANTFEGPSAVAEPAH